MGEKSNEGSLPLDEVRELKREITADLDTRLQGFEKVLDTGVNAIKEMLQGFIIANDKAHDELKADAKELRNSIKEVYLRMNTDKDETDKKISAVRTSVEGQIKQANEEIEKLKLKPGENASKLLSKIGGYIIVFIIGVAITAIIMVLAKGEIPLP